MDTKIDEEPHAISTVKRWEEPERTRVSGNPPMPGETISHTARGETRKQDIIAATPLYKSGSLPGLPEATGVGVHIHREDKVEPTYYDPPDYKIEKEKDMYQLKIIDPKVGPRDHLPLRLHSPRSKTPDFPSLHTKRSFLKLAALEPRRSFRNRPVSSQTAVSWQFSPKSVVDLGGAQDESLKIRTDFSPKKPAMIMQEVFEQIEQTVHVQRRSRRPRSDYNKFDQRHGSTMVRVKDEGARRPRPKFMKQRIMDEFDAMESKSDIPRYRTPPPPPPPPPMSVRSVNLGNGVVEETIEETRHTEEIERTVRGGGRRGHRSYGSHGRRSEFEKEDHYSSHRGGRPPYVEFPPTLPRSERGMTDYAAGVAATAATDERHHRRRGLRRDYCETATDVRPFRRQCRDDWALVPRSKDDAAFLSDKNLDRMTNMEREFREASLAQLPMDQSMSKREYREQPLAGGRETFSQNVKSETGLRGQNSEFSQVKQDLHYKREQNLTNDRFR